MFKEKKYHGEIWTEENERDKRFCLLRVKKGKVYLHTDLHNSDPEQKIEVIYGLFNGLGYVTLVNNVIQNSTSGIIVSRVYEPEFTFSSGNHIVQPSSLKFKEFQVELKTLSKWLPNQISWDFKNEQIVVEDSPKIKILVNEGLSIEIFLSKSYRQSKNAVSAKINGVIKFLSTIPLPVLEAIEQYKKFQKFLILYFGSCDPFLNFKFRCMGCKKWASLYYEDDLKLKASRSLLRLEYRDIKESLAFTLQNWYNDDAIQYCSDILLSNVFSKGINYHGKFLNSISAFEAYNQRFGATHKSPTLKRYLEDHKAIFKKVLHFTEEQFYDYVLSIIRCRDFFVHRNTTQSPVFSQFEMLYISLTIDTVVLINISERISLGEEVIDRLYSDAESTIIHSQSLNKYLDQNIFNSTSPKHG